MFTHFLECESKPRHMNRHSPIGQALPTKCGERVRVRTLDTRTAVLIRIFQTKFALLMILAHLYPEGARNRFLCGYKRRRVIGNARPATDHVEMKRGILEFVKTIRLQQPLELPRLGNQVPVSV